MKCDKILETMPDLAAGIMAATPEINDHLRSCPACATKLDEMQKTMALLDEWQVPEPSPYFDVRLQAQLREEMAKPATAWFEWLRRPALAVPEPFGELPPCVPGEATIPRQLKNHPRRRGSCLFLRPADRC